MKVIYGSLSGFHAIDVDSGTPYDLYLPTHVGPKLIMMLLTVNRCQHTRKLRANSGSFCFLPSNRIGPV